MSRRHLLWASTLLLAPGPAAAEPVAPTAVRGVAGLLLAYDHAPDRKALETVAPDPVRALLAVRADPAQPKVVRLRALDALGLFPSLEVRGLLHRLARDRTAPSEARHHAATALVFAWGDGALASVEPLLRDPEPALRLTVAEALLRHGGPAGRRAVRAAAAAEKLPEVARSLRSLLVPPAATTPELR